MRWCLSIAATLMFSTPLAEASRKTCTAALLDGPTHELRRKLRVSSGQARELRSIRHYSNQRRTRLERWIEHIRAERRHPRDPRRSRQLIRRERKLVRQLEREPHLAAERALTVLSPWQRRRCSVMTEPRERRRPVIIPRAPRAKRPPAYRDWRGNKIYRPTPPRIVCKSPVRIAVVHPPKIAVWHPPKIRVRPLHKRPPRPAHRQGKSTP